MGFEWKADGFLQLVAKKLTKLVIGGYCVASTNPVVKKAGPYVYKVVEKVIEGVSFSKEKSSADEQLIKAFENSICDSLIKFEKDGKLAVPDNSRALSALSLIELNDSELRIDGSSAVIKIKNALIDAGVDFTYVSDNTILELVEEIAIVFLKKIRNDDTLRSLTMYNQLNNIADNQQEIRSAFDAVMESTKDMRLNFAEFAIITSEEHEKLQETMDLTLNTAVEMAKNQELMYQAILSSPVKADEETIVKKQKAEKLSEAIKHHKKFYTDKWNETLFMHKGIDDSRTLETTFVPHDFLRFSTSENTFSQNREEDAEGEVYVAIQGGPVRYLLTGKPGVGKTSLVSYIASRCTDDGKVVFIRLKSLNKYIKDSSITGAIARLFDLDEEYIHDWLLKDGKCLILDGFDEFIADGQEFELLKDFLKAENSGENTIIVTSRDNYIQNRVESSDIANCFSEYIKLCEFSEEQVKEYYEKVTGKVCTRNGKNDDELVSDEIKNYIRKLWGEEFLAYLIQEIQNVKVENKMKNLDILGIPVILYMCISLDEPIDIFEENSRYDIYKRVFDLEKGIFNRMKINASKKGYDSEFVRKNKAHFHRLLQQLAYRLFENNLVPIDKDEYILLAQNIRYPGGKKFSFDKDEAIIMDYPINNLFESKYEIEFVHKSIYEYFFAYRIFEEIRSIYKQKNIDAKDFAKRLGSLLKGGVLLVEGEISIYDFLENMLRDEYQNTRDEAFKKRFGDMSIIEEGFSQMLKQGMSYFTIDETTDVIYVENKSRTYDTVRVQESNCFKNMLDIIYIIRRITGNEEKIIFEENNEIKDLLVVYICAEKKKKLNLSGFNLSKMNLSGADMSYNNLSYTKIEKSDLTGADLEFADITGAVINDCDFTNAKLSNIKGDINIIRGNGNKIAGADFTGANKPDRQSEAMLPGNLVEFGTYPQNADGKDSTPVLWRVLDVKGSYALLLSDKILDVRRYHDVWDPDVTVEWKDSDLNRRLNDYFINRLIVSESEHEKSHNTLLVIHKRQTKNTLEDRIVLPKAVANECGVPTSEIAGADEECNKIFLLSEKELFKYFARNGKVIEGQGDWLYELGGEQAAAYATEYAKANKEDKHNLWVNDENQKSSWWLRSVGSGGCAMLVYDDGGVVAYGLSVDFESVGVRPALWVNLKS